jgi:uncharacterized cupin superfamily protein
MIPEFEYNGEAVEINDFVAGGMVEITTADGETVEVAAADVSVN